MNGVKGLLWKPPKSGEPAQAMVPTWMPFITTGTAAKRSRQQFLRLPRPNPLRQIFRPLKQVSLLQQQMGRLLKQYNRQRRMDDLPQRWLQPTFLHQLRLHVPQPVPPAIRLLARP